MRHGAGDLTSLEGASRAQYLETCPLDRVVDSGQVGLRQRVLASGHDLLGGGVDDEVDLLAVVRLRVVVGGRAPVAVFGVAADALVEGADDAGTDVPTEARFQELADEGVVAQLGAWAAGTPAQQGQSFGGGGQARDIGFFEAGDDGGEVGRDRLEDRGLHQESL